MGTRYYLISYILRGHFFFLIWTQFKFSREGKVGSMHRVRCTGVPRIQGSEHLSGPQPRGPCGCGGSEYRALFLKLNSELGNLKSTCRSGRNCQIYGVGKWWYRSDTQNDQAELMKQEKRQSGGRAGRLRSISQSVKMGNTSWFIYIVILSSSFSESSFEFVSHLP